MSDEELQNYFNAFLSSIGIEGKMREIWEREYDADQKRSLLQVLGRKNKITMALGDDMDPEHFVIRLRANSDTENLDTLLTQLQTAPFSWVTQFARVGLRWLFDALGFTLYKMNKTEDIADQDRTRLHLLVLCIEEMVNNGSIGREELTRYSDATKMIVLAMEFVSVEVSSVICEMLAAITILSEATWGMVADALKYYATWKSTSFQSLFQELQDGEDIDFKVIFMGLVNTVVVRCPDINERIAVRGIFIQEGLADIIERLKEDYPDEELLEQFKVFDEELKNDMREARISFDEITSSLNPMDLAGAIWESLGTTPAASKFSAILDVFRDVDNSCKDNISQVWTVLEEIIRNVKSIIKQGKVALRSEDVVIALLGERSRSSASMAPAGSKQLQSASTTSEPPSTQSASGAASGMYIVFVMSLLFSSSLLACTKQSFMPPSCGSICSYFPWILPHSDSTFSLSFATLHLVLLL